MIDLLTLQVLYLFLKTKQSKLYIFCQDTHLNVHPHTHTILISQIYFHTRSQQRNATKTPRHDHTLLKSLSMTDWRSGIQMSCIIALHYYIADIPFVCCFYYTYILVCLYIVTSHPNPTTFRFVWLLLVFCTGKLVKVHNNAMVSLVSSHKCV